jgi:hypothetical protein
VDTGRNFFLSRQPVEFPSRSDLWQHLFVPGATRDRYPVEGRCDFPFTNELPGSETSPSLTAN